MATALNVFRTVTSNLFTSGNVLYTAHSRKTSIVLMIQISNTSNTTANVSFYHRANSSLGFTNVALAERFDIPAGDSASVIGGGTGKLVLETGQSVFARAGDNNKLQLVMSILETAND